MLIIKSLHIIFMTTWFAGLFYLPRLFVYHALCEDEISNERFKLMERKLYYGIMTPGAVLTIFTGLWLVHYWGFLLLWIHIKLTAVGLLVIYHVWCGKILLNFKNNNNTYSHVWFRWFNEFPVLILFLIVFVVILKPS